MKVLVCGSRCWKDQQRFDLEMKSLLQIKNDLLIIHGAARGADMMAHAWSLKHKIKIKFFKADWGLYGKKAGYLRNEEMLRENPDLVIAFHEDHYLGKGTRHMVEIAKLAKIPVDIHISGKASE